MYMYIIGGDMSQDYNTRPVVGSNLNQMQKRAREIDPQNEFVKFMESVQDDMFVKCLYQFNTKCIPAEMAARVERVADKITAKCTISPSNNITVVRCQINFQDDNNDDDSFDEDVIFAVKQFLIDGDDMDELYIDDDNKNDNVDVNGDAPNDDENQIQNDQVQFKYDKTFRVAFKRLKGSHLAYKKAVEDFYYAKEICQAMILDDDDDDVNVKKQQ